MKTAVSVALVVILGGAALYGVYSFRANRLTQVRLDEIKTAEERLKEVERQSAAAQLSTQTPNGDATPAPDSLSQSPPSSDNADDLDARVDEVLERADRFTEEAAKKDPNLAAVMLAKNIPPKATIIPNESMPDKAPDTFNVMFECSNGWFAVTCYRDWAPNGVDRFYDLVRNRFFSDVRVFRVIPDFVAQFGISGDPEVNAQWAGKNIPDDPVKQSNTEGTLTFASAYPTPNSRSTQVFINLKNNVNLDAMGFAPIGKVVFGWETVKSFYSEYGESASNRQQEITVKGNVFLDAEFPKLDSIKRAVFIEDIVDTAKMAEAERRRFVEAMLARESSATSERAPDTYRVKLECSNGTMIVECNRDWAPNAADRFYTLVKEGFYNEARFFRVVPGFVVQFGIPASPKNSQKWMQSQFELDPVMQPNAEGTLAFAKPAGGRPTTQVFVNTGDNSKSLDPQQFAPFGRVVEGFEVATGVNDKHGEGPMERMRQIMDRGNEFMDEAFPGLDYIKTATIIE
ncbi:MAG: hypothetical protein AMXMBFR4_16310 [Candidatus Hydrogenedentota bacterium]